MPKELFPSTFEGDCGHQSDFSERTVRELKAMSQKKKVSPADSAPEEYTMVFYRGKLVEIPCPKQSQSQETTSSPRKSTYSTKRSKKRRIPDAVKTEVALACLLQPTASADWGYRLARQYAERYDAHYGSSPP